MKPSHSVKSEGTAEVREPTRRAVLVGAGAFALGGCATNAATTTVANREPDPAFARKVVDYSGREAPGTIVVDPANHFLYLVQKNGQATRYGVGVGGEGFGWYGAATIHTKQEWPDWYPPKEMLERQPELKKKMAELQSGLGMAGGPGNPLGARAMYLWQGKVDTLFRIHGTVEPWTIGKSVSSGCIRMINQDVIDLYGRTPTGTRVVVLGAPSKPAPKVARV